MGSFTDDNGVTHDVTVRCVPHMSCELEMQFWFNILDPARAWVISWWGYGYSENAPPPSSIYRDPRCDRTASAVYATTTLDFEANICRWKMTDAEKEDIALSCGCKVIDPLDKFPR